MTTLSIDRLKEMYVIIRKTGTRGNHGLSGEELEIFHEVDNYCHESAINLMHVRDETGLPPTELPTVREIAEKFRFHMDQFSKLVAREIKGYCEFYDDIVPPH